MKMRLTVLLLFFSSFVVPSEGIMNMFLLILSSAITYENNNLAIVTRENNSFAIQVEKKKKQAQVLQLKHENKISDECSKGAYYKKRKNNIQQPTKRNF